MKTLSDTLKLFWTQMGLYESQLPKHPVRERTHAPRYKLWKMATAMLLMMKRGRKTLLAGEMWQIACKELSRNSEEEIYRVVRRRLQTWQAQKNQLIEAMHSDSSDIDQPCIFTQPHSDGKRLLPGFSTLKHWNSSEETSRGTLFLTFSSVPDLCSLTTLHGWSILLCATIRWCCHI